MSQKLLGIYSPAAKNERLFLEISQELVTCWSQNNQTGELISIEMFQMATSDVFETAFQEILRDSQILSQYQLEKGIQIIWHNEFAEILPDEFGRKCPIDILRNMLPFQSEEMDTDRYNTKDFTVLFQVKQSVKEIVEKHFPKYYAIHKYGAITKVLTNSVVEPELNLHLLCFQKYCILSAIMNGKLLFIKKIQLLSPLDPVYYIVDAVEQYKGNLEKSRLIISGMVDQDSNLFEALYKYIPNIEWDSVTRNMFDPEKFKEYPQHYFVPFFKYAI